MADEATRRGIAPSEAVTDLATRLLPADLPGRPRLAFVGSGASATGIAHRIDQLLDEGFGQD